MSIPVHVENIAVSNPVRFVLQDNSGAHVTLTACISGYHPYSHAFTYGAGNFTGNLPAMPPGDYPCAFTVQAFRHGALSDTYNCSLLVNGMKVAAAAGTVPEAGFDIGNAEFMLTVR